MTDNEGGDTGSADHEEPKKTLYEWGMGRNQ